MLGRIRGMLGPHTSRAKNDWLLLPGGYQVDVAGILRHQKAVARIAALSENDGARPALTATLFRDERDPKNPDAVAVALVVPGEAAALPVGNLARDVAAAISPILRRLEDYGFRGVACSAALTDGGRRARNRDALGVALDLGARERVEEYVAAVRRDPRAQPVEFEEDPDSPEFKARSSWRVPGWVK